MCRGCFVCLGVWSDNLHGGMYVYVYVYVCMYVGRMPLRERIVEVFKIKEICAETDLFASACGATTCMAVCMYVCVCVCM